MKCGKCGFENLENANYCIKCGSRLDKKIPCPKCGEYISNDAEFCPNCGKKIPHAKENVSNEKFENVKSKISNVFYRVARYVSLFIFIFAIVSCFLPYTKFSNVENIDPDFLTLFFKQWSDVTSISAQELSIMIFKTVVLTIDFAVTISFAIIGLIKLSKSFKKSENIIHAYKYLAILFASKILTSALLINTYKTSLDVNVTFSDNISSFISLCSIHFFLLFAFDCFLNFDKHKISIFIARIILSFGFFIPLLLIGNYGNLYLSITDGGVTTNEGLIYHFINSLFNIGNNPSAIEITTLLLSIVSLLFSFLVITFAYFIIVYFPTSYFKGMVESAKFRIVFYMATISLAILVMTFSISAITEAIVLSKSVDVEGYAVNLTGLTAGNFFLTVLLLGVSIASFNIYSKYHRRMRLEKNTTKIE